MVLTLEFHAAAAPVAHTTPLRSGEKCYVMPRFDLEKWFWAHEKYGVTDVAMVPPVSPSPSPSLLSSIASACLKVRVLIARVRSQSWQSTALSKTNTT